MNCYGARELAESFRTVRRNTIQIAQDIPEDKYGYRATPETQTIAEELAHVACATLWQVQAHGVEKKTFITFDDFAGYMSRSAAEEKKLTTKADVIAALTKNGEEFAKFLERLSDDDLAERVSFPPPVQPSSRTRFEMVLSAKEHEMHHRGKLMLTERLIGIVPHLTRARQQRMAPDTAAAKS